MGHLDATRRDILAGCGMTPGHATARFRPRRWAASARAAIGVLGLFVLFACGNEEPQSPAPLDLDPIALSLRVHLLESDAFDPLDATLSDGDAAVLLEGVNDIWAEAGIRWDVETILREPAQNATEFARVLRGDAPLTLQTMLSIFPKDDLLAGQWNVVIIRDLGELAGGVYLDPAGVVIFAESGPIGPQTQTGSGPRILAHELGHSLALGHVPCTADGNLMAPNCPSRDRTRLIPEQIEFARLQAERGKPFGLQ